MFKSIHAIFFIFIFISSELSSCHRNENKKNSDKVPFRQIMIVKRMVLITLLSNETEFELIIISSIFEMSRI